MGAGLEAYLDLPAGVAVVEWIDRWLGKAAEPAWAGRVPSRYRRVLLESVGEQERRITYEDFGA